MYRRPRGVRPPGAGGCGLGCIQVVGGDGECVQSRGVTKGARRRAAPPGAMRVLAAVQVVGGDGQVSGKLRLSDGRVAVSQGGAAVAAPRGAARR